MKRIERISTDDPAGSLGIRQIRPIRSIRVLSPALFENVMSLLTKAAHVDMLCLIVPKVLLTIKEEKALSIVTLWRRGTVVLLALLAMVVAACGGTEDAQQAPSFTLTGAAGEQVSLSDYVGSRPVLLYFHMAVG